jgi:AcrR family transcriptional regulator
VQPADALDGALRTFWARGYAGTSLDDLCAATGMNRPSLYAAFGNKEAVYAAAVAHYVATVGQELLAPLMRGRGLARDLAGFYAAVVDVVTGRHGPRGCIVACTLPAEAEVSPDAQALLARALAQLDGAVEARLRAAQDAGDLPAGADPRVLAQVVTGGMLSLSLRARAGTPRPALKRLAEALARQVVAPDRGLAR